MAAYGYYKISQLCVLTHMHKFACTLHPLILAHQPSNILLHPLASPLQHQKTAGQEYDWFRQTTKQSGPLISTQQDPLIYSLHHMNRTLQTLWCLHHAAPLCVIHTHTHAHTLHAHIYNEPHAHKDKPSIMFLSCGGAFFFFFQILFSFSLFWSRLAWTLPHYCLRWLFIWVPFPRQAAVAC